MTNVSMYLNLLKENKDAIQVVLSILKLVGAVFLSLAGIFFAYFALSREIKFGRIKKLLEEYEETRKKILGESVKLRQRLGSLLTENSAKELLSEKHIKEIQTDFKDIFALSFSSTIEIANQIYLLEVLIGNIGAILRKNKNQKFNEKITNFDLIVFLRAHLDRLIFYSSKFEKIPTICDLLFPNRSVKEFNKRILFFTNSKAPKQSKVFESGINFSIISPSILGSVIQTLYNSTELIPYALFSNSALEDYVARALYTEFKYFPVLLKIKEKSTNGQFIQFRLFKIQKTNTLFTNEKNTTFSFINVRTYERFGEGVLQKYFTEKKGELTLHDDYLKIKVKIHKDQISFGSTVEGAALIQIKVSGFSNLRFLFFLNILKIIKDRFRKRIE